MLTIRETSSSSSNDGPLAVEKGSKRTFLKRGARMPVSVIPKQGCQSIVEAIKCPKKIPVKFHLNEKDAPIGTLGVIKEGTWPEFTPTSLCVKRSGNIDILSDTHKGVLREVPLIGESHKSTKNADGSVGSDEDPWSAYTKGTRSIQKAIIDSQLGDTGRNCESSADNTGALKTDYQDALYDWDAGNKYTYPEVRLGTPLEQQADVPTEYESIGETRLSDNIQHAFNYVKPKPRRSTYWEGNAAANIIYGNAMSQFPHNRNKVDHIKRNKILSRYRDVNDTGACRMMEVTPGSLAEKQDELNQQMSKYKSLYQSCKTLQLERINQLNEVREMRKRLDEETNAARVSIDTERKALKNERRLCSERLTRHDAIAGSQSKWVRQQDELDSQIANLKSELLSQRKKHKAELSRVNSLLKLANEKITTQEQELLEAHKKWVQWMCTNENRAIETNLQPRRNGKKPLCRETSHEKKSAFRSITERFHSSGNVKTQEDHDSSSRSKTSKSEYGTSGSTTVDIEKYTHSGGSTARDYGDTDSFDKQLEAATLGKIVHSETRDDGYRRIRYDSGISITVMSNGNKRIKWPEGLGPEGIISRTYYNNGDRKSEYGSGEVLYWYVEQGTKHLKTDIANVFLFVDGQTESHYSDGSKEICFISGATKFVTPTGEVSVSYVDDKSPLF